MSSTFFTKHGEIKNKRQVLQMLTVSPSMSCLLFFLFFPSCSFVFPMISSGNFISAWSAMDCADYQTNDIWTSYHCNTSILLQVRILTDTAKLFAINFAKFASVRLPRSISEIKKSINILICYLSLSVTHHFFTEMITF